jgi:citronellol/citronellal dehydrogenase
MGKLDGKVAIVTGASRGIGKGVALLFAEEGAKVVVCARTLLEGDHILKGSLNSTVADIEKAGGTVLAVQGDVSREESCAEIVERARRAFGPIDILVNNAMWSDFTPIKDMSVKRWARSFAVNTQGPFMLSRMVLPDMIAKRSGAIVNVSSNGAIGPGRGPYSKPKEMWYDMEGVPSATLYGATKAALERFTQGLAEEVYPYAVAVACVAPSVGVATEGNIHFKLFTGPDDPRSEPLSYMARSILLLASEPLDKVTGRVTYSQQILREFGWLIDARGFGVDEKGSGFSQM